MLLAPGECVRATPHVRGRLDEEIAMKNRQAFTLVELLVVIAIMGVLIGLLLPAVEKVRATAARAQCQKNMAQLTLAFHEYENTYKVLPPSYVSDPTKPSGWGIYLLPNLEQEQLFQMYNFNAPFYYDNPAAGILNQPIVNTLIRDFQCPMTPIRDDPYTYTFTFPGFPSITWQASPSDYSPVQNVSAALASFLGLTQSDSQLQGALQPDVGGRMAQITDGTSNTILLAEIAGKNWLWQAGLYAGKPLSGFFGGEGGWGDATSGASALYGSSADGTVFPGTCGINCSNDFGFYSFHPTGANFAFADGSIRFLSNATNIRVLATLVTRAGGDNTSDY
jgi:prepilin-type N-terminal cleavage/methylation domain-containing protein/prepilin-type processing-associated H-X9-DG protein